ncbi:MAG: amidase [Rhodopseudomonas sp.]|uniref:amidase family protein n=1 Tax=Rhodopseudomonas sp. TaxID=1078 RepID=UPI00180F6B44|nr:amidase family protein [Rhodopseudomonas sp.]NVN88296.1 amidase [Rhodopseudomonas sp.]
MIHQQSFAELRRQYRRGELSPVDVTRSALEHAERVAAPTNAFALLDPDRALAAAHRSQQRWRSGQPTGDLDGMPVTVKEFAAVQGWPTRRASLTTSTAPAPASTVFVARLEAAGAVLLGKTRAPEFNWKGVTDSPGFGITRNPWNLDLTPGGSSGGCAAAVAAGVVRVSFGSDAGGSVRIPAAFSGILGLKPTFGLIPVVPFPSHFSNTAHVGPLGISSTDMIEALQIVGGSSASDWTSVSESAEARAAGESPIENLRIGLLDPAQWSDSAPIVRAGVDLVAATLRAEGLHLREVDFDVRNASVVGQELYELACAQIVRGIAAKDRALLDPALVECADAVGEPDLQDYFALMQRRDAHGAALAALFETVDVLLMPTVPITAFGAGRNVPEGWHDPNWFSWNPYTPAFNGLHAPALSYPVWPAGADLPVGVQLVARKLSDRRLLRLAAWLETRIPIRLSPLAEE